MSAQTQIRWFNEIGLDDVPEVGGKTASLGELYSVLGPQGVRVPDGFAIIAVAVRLNAASLFRTNIGGA